MIDEGKSDKKMEREREREYMQKPKNQELWQRRLKLLPNQILWLLEYINSELHVNIQK